MRKILLILLVTFYAGSTFSQNLGDEILKLAQIDLLPQFQNSIENGQVSSYDTTGGNDDGFSGKYSFVRKENGNLVIADLKGPGVIQRIWTPTPTEDTIQFFFDGEAVPRIELNFIDLFSGKQHPFLNPVVGNEIGGYYCYFPIPYEKSCKVVFKGRRLQFYQIQYKKMLKGTISSYPKNFSKKENDALSSVINVWKKSGENIFTMLPFIHSEEKSVEKDVILNPGEIKSVFDQNKGGRIVGIEITPHIQLNSQIKDLIIRARWDDEPVDAIDSPLSDFFGYAFGKPSAKSLLLGVNNGTHYCYIPMPFNKKAHIELEFLKNPLNNTTAIPVNVKVYYSDEKRNKNEGKLYTDWNREINPEMGKPFQILKKTGRGHHVGTILQSQGLNPGLTSFFEGDDKCYIDGELRLHGTGSEDYFNGGWYAVPDRWDQGFSLPLHGCLTYSVPLSRTGGYRFLIADKISFEQNISLSIEHGPTNNNTPVDYTSVAFYYCDTPPVSNKLLSVDLLKKVETPETHEYLIELIPIRALSQESILENTSLKDEKSGKIYRGLKYTNKKGYIKFELEVPSDGEYKLYMSYFKGPDCGLFDINQRQIPIKNNMDGFAIENIFIEKEFVGTINIKEGTNTITINLKENSNDSESNMLFINKFYLERE